MPNGTDRFDWLRDWWRNWFGGAGGAGGAGGRPRLTPSPWLTGFGQRPAQQVPGQYTPSQGFGMIPYGGVQGPYAPTRAVPGTIPVQGMTPVEQALAAVGQLAAGQPAAGPAEREERERPGPQFPGYWAAIGQQPGNYPVPQGAVQGMWGPRKPWEEWSWRTRGIPLQGYEILRVEGGRPPWGRAGGGRRRRGGGGGGGGGGETPPWQPGGWAPTF